MNPNRRRCSSSNSNPLTRSEFLRLSPWNRERATRLHRQFIRVEQARKKGKSVTESFRPFAFYWRGEFFRRDSSKRVRFSISTLRRCFYTWLTGGRTPEAIALRYGTSAKLKPTLKHLARYVNAVADPDVLTMHAGFIKSSGGLQSQFKWSFFSRALPSTLRAPVRRLLKSRRKHRSEQRRFARFVTGFKSTPRRIT
ncbi:MAG: hypothetical protein HOP33_01845 [Verrucomicrobia bacterium]|nr:hypothetical protein [Verrucomicrobiota bacterium]